MRLARSGAGGELGREPRLRGREAELADVAERIRQVRDGHGGVVLVEGAPGDGKSRLVREARAIARAESVRVLGATGEHHRRGVPFGVLRRALGAGEQPVAGTTDLPAPAVPAAQHLRPLRALQDELRLSARDQPLLVAIDDLQWCDGGTLLALRALPARLSGHAILWLVTVRAGASDAGVRATVSGLAGAGAHTIRLGPLPDDAVARIAGDLLGAEPGAGILHLLGQTGGRPLLVTETVLGLMAEGAVTRADGVAHLAAGHAPIPLHGSAHRLLGHLSPVAREVLRLASVLGRDLDAARLADLSGRHTAELVGALQEAVDAGLVAPTDPLTFRHDMVREAIRETVPEPHRRATRKRAAELSLAQGTPTAQVAVALAEAAEPGDHELVALLRRTLPDLAQGSPDTAVAVARKTVALAAAGGSAHHAEAVADALPLLVRVGRGGEGRVLTESALAEPLPAAVEARVRLAAALAALQGSFTEVLRHSTAGTRLDGVPEGLRAPLLALRCLATLLTGDATAAERLVTSTTDTVPRAGSNSALALLRAAESVARVHRLDFTAAEHLAAEAVTHVPEPSALYVPAVWRASLYGMTGRVREGLRATADGVAAARRPGHAQGLNLWLTVRARLLLAAGRLAEARAEAEAALATAEASGAGDTVSFEALSVIGRVGLLTADPAASQRAAAHAERTLASETGPMRAASARLAARLADGTGDLRRVRALLEDGALVWGSPAWSEDPAEDPALVRTALRCGARHVAAGVVAQSERRVVLNPGFPFFRAVADHSRGLLDDDLKALRRAVRTLRGLAMPLPLASALEDTGRLLLKSDADAAAGPLADAERMYARTGAENEAGRVRRLSGKEGLRRRRPPAARGWDALTPAERRVASLVAEGATNRQAAEALFLSPATVGTHVRHVFRKLGLRSRVELARVYLERDATAG
ncbi:AAA family ATPase [Streptomyces sp. WMMC500]|uniref:ATP-binding protein n=1 Tax=Streptomyces sp. WMMC500 TaxID=3015154 RepID=UPI00248B6F9E|nr:LuxR family transcriptional regulator [Streptomyces sp. WMMC500]WBB61220.1 AAA family ATPase [Streptomyces sp. WMMC500]